MTERRRFPAHPAAWLLAALAIVPATAAVAEGTLERRRVGRQPDGTVVLPTNQVVAPAGAQLEFRGRPTAVALSPDGRTAAFLVAYHKAVVLVDVASWTVKQEFGDAGSASSFDGIVYSRDGSRLYASQSSGRILIARVAADGTLSLDRFFSGFSRPFGNPNPGGLALSEDGRTLYVVLNRNNTVAAVDLATLTVTSEIPVGNAPVSIAVRGSRAYVANQGGRPARDGDLVNGSGGTSIVADHTTGGAATGTVSIVDLAAGVETAEVEVGLHPTALLLDGRRLFVANTNSDTVSIIDTERGALWRTVSVKPFPGALFGSSPNALASIGGRLVVSLGRANALAVYELGERAFEQPELVGLVPTAWYPASLAVDGEGRLLVANAKGVGSLGPDATVGPDPATNRTGHYVHSNLGSASRIALPTGDALHALTERVLRNNNWLALHDGDERERASRDAGCERDCRPVPLPERTGDPSVFKHVFYVVKENRTYDQVFGDLPQGNGDPALVQFGRSVTPNHHALAEQFVLLDNLYDSGSLSADGHQWVTQAFVVDYLEKAFGGFVRSYPFNGGDALAYAPSGFLWDNALRFGKTVRAYGEYANGLKFSGPEGRWKDFFADVKVLRGEAPGPLHVQVETTSDVPSLQSVLVKDYPGYTNKIPDVYRAEIFLRDFRKYVEEGSLPQLVIIALNTDHTSGLAKNYPTPRAQVADNDLALGRIVEAISKSPYWKDSVIFVVEDDAQNGVDHVDGHRTVGLVISPYTKRGVVDSRYYSQIDMVRSMEQILGLPPMNQMDLAVPPDSMKAIFTETADPTPFAAVPNQIPLDEMNPGSLAQRSLVGEWVAACSEMDFSAPDRADAELLNRAIWYATKGFDQPYPGDDRVLTPSETRALRARRAARADQGG